MSCSLSFPFEIFQENQQENKKKRKRKKERRVHFLLRPIHFRRTNERTSKAQLSAAEADGSSVHHFLLQLDKSTTDDFA